MATRTATTRWTGGLHDGSGSVELTTSGVGNFTVSLPTRVAERAGGSTSPEELLAAAQTACYAMQLSALLSEAGVTELALEVTADVTLGPDSAGGFRIVEIALEVRSAGRGVTETILGDAAQIAKDTCPVSKALSGTSIRVTSALA